MLEALPSLTPAVKMIYFMKVAEVAALLRVDPKTLQRKRVQRERALEIGDEIDGIDIASVPFVPGSPEIRYAAIEIEAYLRRVSQASGTTQNPYGLGRSSASRFMGFQLWMSIANPVDDWPFSIDSSGRPMDLAAAIILGETTGAAERLTLRQFSERLADASGKSFQIDEKLQLDRYIPPKSQIN